MNKKKQTKGCDCSEIIIKNMKASADQKIDLDSIKFSNYAFYIKDGEIKGSFYDVISYRNKGQKKIREYPVMMQFCPYCGKELG